MIIELDQNLGITKEEQILLLCARTQITKEIEAKLRKMLQKDIDWGYLIQLSYENKLTQLLYKNLDTFCHDLVPEEVMIRLKRIFQENVMNNLKLLGELLKILKILKSHDIIAIPYKGPSLAILAYGNIAFRMFNDLDIFIFKKDILKARDILISNGYIPEFKLKKSNETKYIESQREMIFFNKNQSINVDIHWKFSAQLFSLPKIKDNIGNNLIYKKINNFEINTLSNEDMLLVLCLHNAGHRWTRLAWISDISELINTKQIKWSKVIKKAERLYLKRILLINLCLTIDLLGLTIPKEISTHIKLDKNVVILSNHIKQRIFSEEKNTKLFEEIFISLKLRDNIFYGIKDGIRNAMFPTPTEWGKFNLPTILFPIYYIYRPFYIIFRYKFK